MSEWVRNELIDRALRTQERRNLRERGKSLTWVSMSNTLSRAGFYLEVGDGVCLLKDGWREFIKGLE